MLYKIFSVLFAISLTLGCSKKQQDNPSPIILSGDSAKIDTPLEFIILNNDTLFAETFSLKNNYKLFLYPSGNELSYTHNARLKGNGIDTVLLSVEVDGDARFWLQYDSIDFDNYLGLSYDFLKLVLFEKETGKKIIDDVFLSTYDLKNQLLLFVEKNENEDRRFTNILYDIQKNKSYILDTPKEHGFEMFRYWIDFKIIKVTPSMIYIEHPMYNGQFKIKR